MTKLPDYLSAHTSTHHITHQQNGQTLVLFSEKAMYWVEKSTLILSDVHLGKADHFRRWGIAVPAKVHDHDLARISQLIKLTEAKRVIFLGDLFHSRVNNGWWEFIRWLDNYPDLEFSLVKGNHDILAPRLYNDSPLKIYEHELIVYPFLLTHEPCEGRYHEKGLYNICGHIHPAVQLKGGGLQRVTLACFYFGLHYALMPAFGKFTGFCKIKPKLEDSVFAVGDNEIFRL